MINKGQQGDPLEMIRFAHTIHPLWGGVMARYLTARAAAYAVDEFIKADLLTTLKILADLKHAFKMNLDMDLTVHKCKVLLPGISQAEAHAAIRLVIESHPHLSTLNCMISGDALAQQPVGDRTMVISDIVKTDGLVCVGVPIGTPTFVQQLAASKTLTLIEDLRQLRIMSDPLIHYHLVRFYGITRPSYMCQTLPRAV